MIVIKSDSLSMQRQPLGKVTFAGAGVAEHHNENLIHVGNVPFMLMTYLISDDAPKKAEASFGLGGNS
jgi:hypothetical protein